MRALPSEASSSRRVRACATLATMPLQERLRPRCTYASIVDVSCSMCARAIAGAYFRHLLQAIRRPRHLATVDTELDGRDKAELVVPPWHTRPHPGPGFLPARWRCHPSPVLDRPLVSLSEALRGPSGHLPLALSPSSSPPPPDGFPTSPIPAPPLALSRSLHVPLSVRYT